MYPHPGGDPHWAQHPLPAPPLALQNIGMRGPAGAHGLCPAMEKGTEVSLGVSGPPNGGSKSAGSPCSGCPTQAGIEGHKQPPQLLVPPSFPLLFVILTSLEEVFVKNQTVALCPLPV